MKKKDASAVETLLRSHEPWCMNACNRYLKRASEKDNVWLVKNRAGIITALMIRYNKSLLPVLDTDAQRALEEPVPPPDFLRGFFGVFPVHSLQGRAQDMAIMETALEKIGLYAEEKIDYVLMCIDRAPSDFYSPCAGVVFRKPNNADKDALAALQAAYEQEEVMPSASEFSAAASRLNTERIFAKEQIYAAEIDGRLIGKINTNAATFTRYQVGGVYVLPEYRGRGIARRMAGEFITELSAQGRGISLFVKKSNTAARNVYLSIGFEIFGDYRISYY